MMTTKEANINNETWDQEITMERFFQLIKLPDEPIKLDKITTIIDLPLFIKSHLDIVKAQNGKKRYEPYLDRLKFLRSMICSK